MSQAELARALQVTQSSVAYWETAAKPPRSEILAQLATALGVRVEDLLGDTPVQAVRRPGPVGKLERVLEEARALPRRDQELVVKFVSTLVEQHRKAG